MERLISKRFGYWTVVGRDGRHLLTRCRCGTKSRALPADLRNGKTTKCRRCSYNARIGKTNESVLIHGMSDTPTQWVWSDMKRRCYQKHRRGYENYGGRGIRICSRWLTGDGDKAGFACFLEDMGPRPSRNHQIDRIDNDGDYTPQNCRWVPKSQQDYNKRNTFLLRIDGDVLTLPQAESRFGIKASIIFQRISTYGWSHERAVNTPIRK